MLLSTFFALLMGLAHSPTAVMIACLGLFVAGLVVSANFDYPGVQVNEAVAGAIPIERVSFKTMKMALPTLRGPVAKPTLITSQQQFEAIFGPRWLGTYAHDAMRQWFTHCSAPLYFVRVVNAGGSKATKTLIKAGTKQVITATAAGAITQNGNIAVTVTTAGMTGSPKTIQVAALNGDSAATWAGKVRTALGADADVTAVWAVSGAGTSIVLTKLAAAANDATANIALANNTTTGVVAAPNSVNTTPGVADVDALRIDSLDVGADYNFTANPRHGISLTLVGGVLSVFDAGKLIEQYKGVTYANSAKAAQFINGHSTVINISWLDVVDPDDYASATGIVGGADGSAVTATQVIGSEAADPKTGLYALADESLPLGFFAAPGYTTNAVGQALIDLATRFRGYAAIDATYGLSDADATTERDGYGSSHGYAGYYYDWVSMSDPDTGEVIWRPTSVLRCALIVASQSQPGGLANVGAGVDASYRGVVYDPQNGAFGLSTDYPFMMDNNRQGELNRNGINVGRNFAKEGYGIVAWSARTISPEVLFRFVHVRILLNVIAESIEIGLKPYVFRSIDPHGRLGSELKGSIDGLLWDLWNNDSLFGNTAGEAFKVTLQSSFVELEQGIINIQVYVKPVPIAERINVTLFRVPLGYDFKTGRVTIGDAELTAAA